jgi:hypothetical protein
MNRRGGPDPRALVCVHLIVRVVDLNGREYVKVEKLIPDTSGPSSFPPDHTLVEFQIPS